MNKKRTVIEPNATIVFDRDVKSSELSKLPINFEGDIIINGILTFDNENTIKCDNLYAAVVVSDSESVNIIGNLYTERDINVYDIEVDGSIYCGNDFSAVDVSVAGDCVTDGTFGESCSYIEIGGNFITNGGIDVRTIRYIKVLGAFKGKIQNENPCDYIELDIGL